jgi:hypothetical protein
MESATLGKDRYVISFSTKLEETAAEPRPILGRTLSP